MNVAKTTLAPIWPTMAPPVVNSPTPMTVPAVMVMASRSPNARLSARRPPDPFSGDMAPLSSVRVPRAAVRFDASVRRRRYFSTVQC